MFLILVDAIDTNRDEELRYAMVLANNATKVVKLLRRITTKVVKLLRRITTKVVKLLRRIAVLVK
jgi:uncharacterized protein YggT (Ycf19 family)